MYYMCMYPPCCVYAFALMKQVREESTGMPDEKHYVGTLLELDEALKCLPRMEAHITQIAYWHWQRTAEIEEERSSTAAEAEADGHGDHDDHSHRHRRASAGEVNI